MTKVPTVLELLEAGAHFGHQSSRWHPKMQPYIFGERNGVHIIDLEKTIAKLEEAQKFIKQIVTKGGTILLLGTKKQVHAILEREAKRCAMPYISNRWIGGFLTNFTNVIKLAKRYKDLVQKRDSGQLDKYTKKERVNFEKEIAKLESEIFGVKDVERIPEAIFVWDVRKERTALAEAHNRKVPIIGICDTNVNPEEIEYVIPVNDDATKTIDLVMKYIADCIIDAKAEIAKNQTEKK